MAQSVVTKVKVRAYSIARKTAKGAPHIEHWGFVAYAGFETFGLHELVWAVSCFLFVIGMFVALKHREVAK